jgi:hypothetical protein
MIRNVLPVRGGILWDPVAVLGRDREVDNIPLEEGQVVVVSAAT